MQNEIKIGWIDYSNKDRDKVMSVLHILSEPQAVDELGVGLIRDGFADILFPGTSTVQTRAKYFLIVPYLLMELEKERHKSESDMLSKLAKEEIELIDILGKEDAEGVIGKRSKSKLKRKPSSIYWNGLRTFGLFKYDKLSLESYVKAFYIWKKKQEDIKKSGYVNIDDTDAQDDEYVASSEVIGEFWRCIVPDKNWRENLSIELTKEEAQYLKSKILKSPKSKDTLLSYLLKSGDKNIEDIKDFNDIGEIYDLPHGIKEDYIMARDFSDFIYGGNIRYNYILSGRENEDIEDQWNNWHESEFFRTKFANYDVNLVFNKLNIRNSRLLHFLNKYKEKVLSGNLEELDEFIIQREIEIKGKARAKLCNPKYAYYKDENRTRGGKLEFRFTPGKRLIIDIIKVIGGKEND